MPPPPTNPIHLYRSLLRECTYLFDTHARLIIPTYIRSSFTSHTDPLPARLPGYLKLGRRTHSLLIRANCGETKSLLRVLRHAYGRQGKRARELLNPLTTKTLDAPLIPDDPGSAPPMILPQLRTLAQAQQGRVKRLTPLVPKTNIYGKPFPVSREVNLRWKTYNEALQKLLPPTPAAEIERLEKLVTGELDQPVVPRRARPEGQGEMDAGEVRRREVLVKADGHNVKKQFRRRMYTNILAESPRLYYDEGKVGDIDGVTGERPEGVGRWAVEFSPLSRGKRPVEGLWEEFDEDESQRESVENSGGRGSPGLVGLNKKEKLKANI